MYSMKEHKGIIQGYLVEEERAERIRRVASEDGAESVQCSPFGVIPKKGRPGKWCLIVNLSAPEGRSVNEGINKELCKLKYILVDDVVQRVLQLGEGAEITKARQGQEHAPTQKRGSSRRRATSWLDKEKEEGAKWMQSSESRQSHSCGGCWI